MPHSLFLGSALATQDRVSSAPLKELPTASVTKPHNRIQWLRSTIISTMTIQTRSEDEKVPPCSHQGLENNTLAFVKAHLGHAIFDLVVSLLGFAVVINALWVLS